MSEFDIRTAIFLAAVCSQTYTHYNDSTGRFVIPYSYELVADIRAQSFTGVVENFGFILQSDSHLIVAFRGTSTTTDWISDAMASQVKFKYVDNAGLGHRGFSNIYNSARDSILASLGQCSDNKRLYLTGHSLGGALATLCALDVAVNSSFRCPSIYTFGSPRVGDPEFSRMFGNKVEISFRVNNRYDVVTHLPPPTYRPPRREKTFRYMHVNRSERLSFHNGSVAGNHVISSYYEELAKKDPRFAEQLSVMNPGFCPTPARYSFV